MPANPTLLSRQDQADSRPRLPRPPGWIGAWVCLPLIPAASLLDRPFTALFWRAQGGFFLAHDWPLELVYQATRWMTWGIAAGLLLALIGAYGLAGKRPQLQGARGKLWFAALALAIGPGLITNTLLKDHWGRPRPSQTADFGGSGTYVPPWQPSDQCSRNCSFPSGHAAMGFYLITGAWLWPTRRLRWVLTGLAAGAGIGMVRVMQGGHFLSDVIGALAMVLITNAALDSAGRHLTRRQPP